MKPFSGNEAPPAPKIFKVVLKKSITTGLFKKKKSFEYVTITVQVGIGAESINIKSDEFEVDHIKVIS